jgi:hypothetical protein
MQLDEKQQEFLEKNHAAAMITTRADGSPHAVRCGIALIDGKLWSSGVPERVRNRHLERDPRCAFFVYEPGFRSLTLEGKVRVLDGPEAPAQSLRLFRVMQSRPSGPMLWEGKEVSEARFLDAMRAERRLIYELEPERAYGLL